MSKALVLVESPAKAKKIQKLLGSDYRVKASFGHVRDLPKEYGVDLETFEETWETTKPEVVQELKKLLRSHSFDRVLLAPDRDREGEAIAWHLCELLDLSPDAVDRIEFSEITKSGIEQGIASPQKIDSRRVDAQRCRRIIDRIVGYDVSGEICQPAGAPSAGRVQTPALHILCEREREIQNFVPETYFTLHSDYQEGFEAFVPAVQEEAKADAEEGSEDDEDSGSENGGGSSREIHRFASCEEAESCLERARGHDHHVVSVDRKRSSRASPPPYTTSTLQQDASRKLKLSAGKTMELAQKLYENGHITYHRTDSVRVSPEAVQMARDWIQAEHPEVLPDKPPQRKTKGDAQDAHEAVRPTRLDEAESELPDGTASLYRMIRARFLASQCKPAVINRTALWIRSGEVDWKAKGAVIAEQNFLVYWGPYTRDDQKALPNVSEGDVLTLNEMRIDEQTTSPPPRHDVASLIKRLERSGVGRPSTYAQIVETLLRRGYVAEESKGKKSKKTVLVPQERGMNVDRLLSEVFPELVTEDYTARMESELDEIEEGRRSGRVDHLTRWYSDFRATLEAALPKARDYIQKHGLRPVARNGGGEDTSTPCDRCGEANYRKIQRKNGKGSFLACPSCQMTRDVRAKVRPGACPQCESALIQKKTRKKDTFWGCVRYGADTAPCDYAEWPDGPGTSKGGGHFTVQDLERTCPKCEKGTILDFQPKEGSGRTRFRGCSENCGLRFDPEARGRKTPCPECGSPVIQRWPKSHEGPKGPGTGFWGCVKYPDCTFTESCDD